MKEIFINQTEEKREIMMVQNEILTEYYEENNCNKRLEGNIYLGKVQNVIKGMQAAFINIGEGKNAFIHIKDVLPKKSLTDYSSNNHVQISELIKPGDTLLVQVKKDDVGYKGCKVSTHINFTGRYIVILPNADFITISQKISDEKEKERLISIVRKYLPDGFGAIIRTLSNRLKEEKIKSEIDNLLNKWNSIKNKASDLSKAPQKLYSNGGVIEKIFLDLDEKNIDRIVTNDNKIKDYIEEKFDIKDKVNLNKDLKSLYMLNNQLDKMHKRKIWLNCGGFITIDKTEALTAIDVNSGKYIGKRDFEETVTKVNEEATVEIIKQLRLRNISGIIIVDYIDMNTEEDKEKILHLLKEEAKKDRSKVQIEGFTKLNLIEMTRKHLYGN